MEAPEKIKIGKFNITSEGTVVFGWVTNEPDCEAMQHNIEYIQTDAFIEKAAQYLKDHKEEVETEDNGIAGWISDCFIEDFKTYMKGE